jgi:dipeptidyl aminopeptidase/acylaminoacyl peptidase
VKTRHLYRFRRISETALSPGGDRLAHVERFANVGSDRFEHELHLTPLTSDLARCGRPTPIPIGVGLRGPAWSADGRRLAAVASSGARDDDRIVILSCDGDILNSFKMSFQGIADLTWSPDDRRLAFLAPIPSGKNRRGDGYDFALGTTMRDLEGRTDGLRAGDNWQLHLHLLDVATGDTTVISQKCTYVNGYAFAPDSPILAYCGRVSQPDKPSQPGTIQPSALWITDWNRPDSPRRIIAADRGARTPTFTRDGTGIVFVGLTGLRVESLQLYRCSLDGGQPQRLAQGLDRSVVLRTPNFQGGSKPVSMADSGVAFCARDRGAVQLYETSTRDPGQLRLIAGSADESISSVSTDRTGERLAFVTTELDGSQRLSVRTHQGDDRVVHRLQAPVPTAVPRPWAFRARDGLNASGWIIRRHDAPPGPLLIDIHGGSFSGAWAPQIDPSHLYQQELADAGWTILLLNARGSDGYGESFARKIVGAWGEADAADFLEAADRLAEDGVVDGARLAVTGYSYGGFMANYLTAISDRLSSSVSGGSIANFVTLFGTSDMGWSMCEYDIGVRPACDPMDAFARSPIARVQQVHTPTLLLHGESDQRCPISQSEEWFAALHARGVPAALVRYPGASHGFLTDGAPSQIVDYGERLVEWVRRHTEGTENTGRGLAVGDA